VHREQEVSEAFNNKRVLVVGATGFYGQHLVNRLESYGAKLFCVSRFDQEAGSKRTWLKGDFTNYLAAEDVLNVAQPDLVYHLTSESRGARDLAYVLPSMQNDFLATINSLVATTKVAPSARFVMTTSLEEPRGTFGAPDCEPTPSSPYAGAKAAAAVYGRMFHALYGLPVVILRPFFTYGYGQKEYKLIPYTILSLMKGEAPQLASGYRLCDFIYIDDVINAFILAGFAPAAVGATIDVGSGELITIRQMVEGIRHIMGGPSPCWGALPDRQTLSAGGIAEEVRRADLRAAAERMGWRPRVPLAVGIQRTIYAQLSNSRRPTLSAARG
jgi:nucleoside-diphosphate-sugar epimerase